VIPVHKKLFESEPLMILHRFLLLGAALAAVTACGSDSTSPTIITPGPAGFIRIVNAVPDTGAQDFRFVDVVEGVPNVEFANLAFRQGTDRGYQRVSVGTHHIRVFMSGSNLNAAGLPNDPAIVSTVLGDTTFTFAEGVHYTFLWQGASRAGAQKFVITTDNFAAPAASQFTINAMNSSSSAADFYIASGTTKPAVGSAVVGTPTFAGVAANTATSWTGFAVGDYTIAVTAAGSPTVIASAVCPAGSAAVPEVPGVSGAIQASAGCPIANSVLTSMLFDPVVVPSKAPQTLTTPGLAAIVDKQPWQ
jgi:hypothetical protein